MSRRTYLLDAGLATGLAGASLALGAAYFFNSPYSEKLLTLFGGSPEAWHRAVLVWWLFGAACVAGIALAHRLPGVALLLATTGAAGHLVRGDFAILPLDMAVPITLYTLANTGTRRWMARLAVLALPVAAYVTEVAQLWAQVRQSRAAKGPAVMLTPLGDLLYKAANQSFTIALLLVLAYALGLNARSRRLHLSTVEQRAADLERERDQRAALATAAERARITRELHDVVAHGLSVMVIQAQGGAAALARHPDRTAAALRQVVGTGRAALAEMRRLLGIARREPDDPARAPLPGVGALPALVDQVRATGLGVRLVVDGEPGPLPTGVDLTTYRVVQEALTNTLRHAGAGASATVRLRFAPDRIEVEVTDTASTAVPVPSTVDDGHGLRGIAERVALFDGVLTAGPVPGGFRLHATLPLDPVPALDPVSALDPGPAIVG